MEQSKISILFYNMFRHFVLIKYKNQTNVFLLLHRKYQEKIFLNLTKYSFLLTQEETIGLVLLYICKRNVFYILIP
jgi:hypothetical protein